MCVYPCASSYFYSMLSTLSHEMNMRLASILFSPIQNSLSYLASHWRMLRNCRKYILIVKLLKTESIFQRMCTLYFRSLKVEIQQIEKNTKNTGAFYPKYIYIYSLNTYFYIHLLLVCSRVACFKAVSSSELRFYFLWFVYYNIYNTGNKWKVI